MLIELYIYIYPLCDRYYSIPNWSRTFEYWFSKIQGLLQTIDQRDIIFYSYFIKFILESYITKLSKWM